MAFRLFLYLLIATTGYGMNAFADATRPSGTSPVIKPQNAPKWVSPKPTTPGAVLQGKKAPILPIGAQPIRTRPFTLAGTGRTIDPRGGVDFPPVMKRTTTFTLAGTGAATTIDRSHFSPVAIRTSSFALRGTAEPNKTLKLNHQFKPMPLAPSPNKK